MSGYERAVFVSYAPGGDAEKIVKQVYTTLQARGLNIVLDKHDLGYKGSTQKFIERIGQGNCVILIISDKYLRSKDCMHVLIEVAENKRFIDRIFPVVLEDADIYNAVSLIRYIKYWEDEIEQLETAVKGVKSANLQGIREDIDLYDRIRDKISGLATILKDMNVPVVNMNMDADFSELYNAVVKRMGGDLPTSAEKTKVEEMSLDDWNKTKINTSGLKDWFRSKFSKG